MSEQDISIKEREHELYVRAVPSASRAAVKPFPVYLRETPGEPLSPATKLVLWLAGVVVAALFVAAIWRVTHPRAIRPKAKASSSAVKSAAVDDLGAAVGSSNVDLRSGVTAGSKTLAERRIADSRRFSAFIILLW